MARLLDRLDGWVQSAGRGVVTLTLVAIMTLLALGILVRAFPGLSLTGYDEVVELLVAWMTFLGAALLWGQGALYRVDVLADRLPPAAARGVAVFVQLAMLLFAVVFTVQGWRVATLSAETTPFLRFPKSIAYASMPAAGVLMIAYTGRALWCRLTGRASPA
jgi:TRAP-type C4-dicarboxylate transport system permease small subunit